MSAVTTGPHTQRHLRAVRMHWQQLASRSGQYGMLDKSEVLEAVDREEISENLRSLEQRYSNNQHMDEI